MAMILQPYLFSWKDIEADSDLDRLLAEAAFAMRSARLLGKDSIYGLHDALLKQGVLALEAIGANNTRFGGLTARAGGYPVIVVGSDWPGDRQMSSGGKWGDIVGTSRRGNSIFSSMGTGSA
jgi:hypothetical protein